MEIIKTTKEQRDLYAKHINKKFIDRLNGESRRQDVCYMCLAADEDDRGEPLCSTCPLDSSLTGIHCVDAPGRFFSYKGQFIVKGRSPVLVIHRVTKKLIKDYMKYIIKQIHKHTDCLIIDDKEAK